MSQNKTTTANKRTRSLKAAILPEEISKVETVRAHYPEGIEGQTMLELLAKTEGLEVWYQRGDPGSPETFYVDRTIRQTVLDGGEFFVHHEWGKATPQETLLYLLLAVIPEELRPLAEPFLNDLAKSALPSPLRTAEHARRIAK